MGRAPTEYAVCVFKELRHCEWILEISNAGSDSAMN